MSTSKKSKSSSKKKSEPKITLHKVDWLGLIHEEVAKKFKGDLTFVNYMNVGKRHDLIAAVYHAAKPDKKLGHKEFMLLWRYYDINKSDNQWMVSGMTREEIEPHLKVQGVACLSCKQALYSLNRHHFHGCGCPNDMFVDGGKDYLRYGAVKMIKTVPVTINLLTDEIVVDAVPTKR